MSSAKAAARYIARGWAPVPIPSGEKGPRLSGWQNLRLGDADVPRYFPNGQNVGLINGDASGGLVTVDLDCPEALAIAGRFLEPTLTSGRESTPDSHWWYICHSLEHRSFETTDDGTILELRSTDHQTVVEPSVHPSGEQYRWSRSGLEIVEVTPEALLDAGRRLAVAALLARYLPEHQDRGGPGGRYHYALAVAGYMLRHGPDQEQMISLLKAAWDARGWEDIEKDRRSSYAGIERAVRDSADKIARDDPAWGGRKLEEMAAGLSRKIADFMGWQRPNTRQLRGDYWLTDLGNAERFVDTHRGQLLWCPARKAWAIWDGSRFAWDERGSVRKLAHTVARSVYKDAAGEPDEGRQKQIVKWASTSQSESRIGAMLNEAKPYLAVGMDELDRDPWLLNCENGTLDLKTGRLKAPDPTDKITKLVPVSYDPDAECPRFKQFLKETLVDEALVSFVKRYSGYTLTGITRERLLAILHGSGKNGKTTLVELLHEVLGDYATNTDVETLLARKYQGVGNDVAALKGARFVSAAEVEQGRRLAESKVKQLTGRDTVTARFLFGEHFNFKPEFKLWLSTNNKPIIQGTDDAIWDRIRLIPFTQRFEGARQDPQLPERLKSELPGVLAWLVEGCLEWQEHGLGEPEQVTAATQQYREEMDTLAAFIEDRCVLRDDATAPATPLYQQYRMWCENAGERPDTQKMFGMRLRDRGFENRQATRGPHKGLKIWLKIGLKVDDDEPEPLGGGGHRIKKPSQSGNNGLPGQDSVDDRLPPESSVFAGKTPKDSASVDDSRQTNQKVCHTQPREVEVLEKRSTSSTSSTRPPTRTPSEEQQREVRKLVREGMAEDWAHRTVLTADHPLDCDCEVCQ